jgi:hypothetical protein
VGSCHSGGGGGRVREGVEACSGLSRQLFHRLHGQILTGVGEPALCSTVAVDVRGFLGWKLLYNMRLVFDLLVLMKRLQARMQGRMEGSES